MKKRILLAVAAVLAALCLIQSVTLSAGLDNMELLSGRVQELDGVWTEEEPIEDGTQWVSYTDYLEDGTFFRRAYLYINTYASTFEINVNGVLCYTHASARDGYAHLAQVGDTNGGAKVEIRFLLSGASSFVNLQSSTFYFGEPTGITRLILSESAYVFVFCIFGAFLALAVFVITFMFRKMLAKGQAGAMVSFGLFILLADIWVLTDSRLLLLATERTAAVALTSFLSFLAMPVFMLRFVRQMMEMDNLAFRALTWLYVINFYAYAVDYLIEAFDLMIPVMVAHSLLLVAMAVVWTSGLRKLRSEPSRRLKLVLMGYACYSLGSAVMLVMYFTDPFSSYTRAYMLGIAGFTVFLFDVACRSVYEQLQRSVDLEVQAKLAYLDVMTNIGNRAAFALRQEQDKAGCGPIAYLMMDINNLKETNDSYGHSAGDKIIIRAARCLKDAVGSEGDCYRLGGDEFVVRLAGVSESEAKECLARVYELIGRENEKSELKLSIAGGCAWTDAPQKDLDALLAQADAIMYSEKQKAKAGRG